MTTTSPINGHIKHVRQYIALLVNDIKETDQEEFYSYYTGEAKGMANTLYQLGHLPEGEYRQTIMEIDTAYYAKTGQLL